MGIRFPLVKCSLAAFLAIVLFSLPGFAQTEKLDELFQQLRTPGLQNYDLVESEIWTEWSTSGSPAMDLLLQRGRTAMEAQDWPTAIGFFSALVDHAPEFAEGWNARATAYFNAGLYGPSVEDIRHVLALNPRHFGALAGLAMILEELGRPEEALRAWQEIEALTPMKASVKDSIKRLEVTIGGQKL
jgi:tetratricopeptide (TPR) repeat protein